MATKRICSIEGCDNQVLSRGWCVKHYGRWFRRGDPLAVGRRTPKGSPLAWLLVHVTHRDTACLIWPFARSHGKVGSLKVEGVTCIAPRYMCSLVNGPPATPDHETAHSCGNGHKGCINPGHLSWKTARENQADRIAHGTHQYGERNAQAKLTEADVREIRRVSGTMPQKDLARKYGVQPLTIYKIAARKAWAHVE